MTLLDYRVDRKESNRICSNGQKGIPGEVSLRHSRELLGTYGYLGWRRRVGEEKRGDLAVTESKMPKVTFDSHRLALCYSVSPDNRPVH
jgi:hypothetical protein